MTALTVAPLAIPDVLLVRVQRHDDARGYFMESYNRARYAEVGIRCEFVQDNRSLSKRRGTVRGLHFQHPPHAQAKLVSVVAGAVFDVAVDLRRNSPTFGRWCGTTLSAAGAEQIFIPRGFAHAFCTLEDNTEVAYKVDGYYSAACDSGLRWNDPDLAIDWPVAPDAAVLSDKDSKLPGFAGFNSPFSYRGEE
jgi:dTDP-4-dehydrorhamnose 3,5-epimerase